MSRKAYIVAIYQKARSVSFTISTDRKVVDAELGGLENLGLRTGRVLRVGIPDCPHETLGKL